MIPKYIIPNPEWQSFQSYYWSYRLTYIDRFVLDRGSEESLRRGFDRSEKQPSSEQKGGIVVAVRYELYNYMNVHFIMEPGARSGGHK